MKRASSTGVSPGISVHIDALEAFAQVVDAVMTDHVHGVSTASTVLGSGIPFGLYSPSGDVQGAKDAYSDAAAGMTDQLKEFIVGLTILADAARQISARYRTVDALRGAATNDVSTMIGVIAGHDTPLPQIAGRAQYS